MKEIVKVGLAVLQAGQVLLVRKRGRPSYILPGGKPDVDENDIETLQREIREELRCDIDVGTVQFLGSFADVAADLSDTSVVVRVYLGELVGVPIPDNEIESADWISINESGGHNFAPSLSNSIIPFLANYCDAK